MGIVLDILPPERIDAHARQIALAMAGLPAGALSTTKRGLNASLNSDLHTMLELEARDKAWRARRLPPRGRRTLPGQTGAALSVANVLNAGGAPRAMPSRRAAGERPRINAQAAAPRPFPCAPWPRRTR